MRSDRCDFRHSCPDYRISNCDKCAAFRDEFDEWLNPIWRLTETAHTNLKGENKMNFMDYVARGGQAYLMVSDGETVPVRIETIETSPFEYTRFEGRILTAADPRAVPKPSKTFPGIKAVHFSGPCTVIVWDDKTKTMVRCKNENIDYEKGFAMAVAKKVFGTNKSGSNYYDIFKKYLPEDKTSEEEIPNVEPAY